MLIVGLAWLLTALFDQAIVSAIVPAIALLIGLLIVMRMLRGVRRAAAPLGDLIEASGRLEAGEVGDQVEVRGPREIRALVQAFNSMSARLAADTEERRRLLADVSHELRTPLTVIQGNVEGMLDGLYPTDRPHLERVLVEARQLERLVEDLRTLSLADAGALPLHREPTDLGVLAADVVAGFEPQAGEGGVDLSVEAEHGRPAVARSATDAAGDRQPAVERAAPHPAGRQRDRHGAVRARCGRARRWRTPAPGWTRQSPARVRPLLAIGRGRRSRAGTGDRA